MNDSQYFRVYGTMDQETRWLTKYKEVMEFIERCHRNPSRHRIEEHDMLNWVKAITESAITFKPFSLRMGSL